MYVKGDIISEVVNGNVVFKVCVEGGYPGKWEGLSYNNGILLHQDSIEHDGLTINLSLIYQGQYVFEIEATTVIMDRVFKNIVHSFMLPVFDADKAKEKFDEKYNELKGDI